MRLLLMADGYVGEKISTFLLEHYLDDLALVVTTEINDIYRNVSLCGVPVCVFDSEKNLIDQIGDEVDLGILAWWPKILKKPLLEVSRMGFVNTHPSLLPHNRGKHYNFWALVEQAPFGVTLHRVDADIDTGDILFQKIISYDWSDTGETLFKKAQVEMVDLFCKSYPLLRIGQFEPIPQNANSGSFHFASELDSACQINLNSTYRAFDLLNLLRARTFEGHPGCWFIYNGSRYEISLTIKKLN